MSNMPQPDVEIVIYSSYFSHAPKRNSKKDSPIMRLRYSRQGFSLELSEQSTGAKGYEWRKECLPCPELDLFVSTNYSRLSEVGRIGLHLVVEFLETCERLSTQDTAPPTDPPFSSRSNSAAHNNVPLSLSSIQIPTKPQKFPSRVSVSCDKENVPPTSPRPASTHKHLGRSPAPIEDALPDTRHMPGVGWCVRRPVVLASPKMKYQLMFHDGACLEVNFYNGVLTLIPLLGKPMR